MSLKLNFFLTAFFSLAFGLTALAGLAKVSSAQTNALSWNANTKADIVLPQNPTPAESTAARDLSEYLAKITGGEFTVRSEDTQSTPQVIYVGTTDFAKKAGIDAEVLASEEWRIKTQNGNLILVGGGTRGTLYATYRFLEDNIGVRWWTPWEESVPSKRAFTLPELDRKGKSAFIYRDIYMLYGNDKGRFGIRNRLNSDGDVPIGTEYGGGRIYGPPDHVHTFYRETYIDPQKYYPAHPDWFVGNGNAAPTLENSQLAMSNPEMRKEFLRLLLKNIRESRAAAIAKGLTPPNVFGISQNDGPARFMGPGDEQLVAENGGAESAILLSFINYLADGIKDEFPDVYIDTLAYGAGLQAPTSMTARDNVIIRLTDVPSNQLLPITAERNHALRDNIEDWRKRCKHLRVWDYNISFIFPELPQPTMQTYQPDLQYFLANNIEGMFIEMEHPESADMRDMKLWVLCKLLEDPHQNYEALVKEFTDGYYGAAGSFIRQYLAALQAAAAKSGANIEMFAQIQSFTYLTTDFLHQADAIYAKAADAVKSDPVLSSRVARARASVDIAMLRRFRPLAREWQLAGKDKKTFPLDREAAGKRYLAAKGTSIGMWLRPDRQESERLKLRNLVGSLTSSPSPAKFKDVPVKNLFTYNAANTRNYLDLAKVVADQDAESGYATRIEIPDSELSKYHLPMPWGIYDDHTVPPFNHSGVISSEDVPGRGYHWFKLSETILTPQSYVYFFWSWYIQNEIGDAYHSQTPDAKYEVWANLKFEGPAFPHGKADEKNAISVERIVVLKK